MYVDSNDPWKYHRSNFKHNMVASHRTDWVESTVMIRSSYGNGYRWLFITVRTAGEILQGPVCREPSSETWRLVVWYIDTDVSEWPVASRSYPKGESAKVLVSASLVQKMTGAWLVRNSALLIKFTTALKTTSYIEGPTEFSQKAHTLFFHIHINVIQQNRLGLKVRGLDPDKGEIFHSPSILSLRPSQPHAVDIGSFPGIKRPWRGAQYPQLFGAKVNDRALRYYSLYWGAGAGAGPR